LRTPVIFVWIEVVVEERGKVENGKSKMRGRDGLDGTILIGKQFREIA